MRSRFVACSALVLLVACSKSSSPAGGDAGVTDDGGQLPDSSMGQDSGTDAGTPPVDAGFDADVPVCGNHLLQVGEECDDGNQVDTDACRNDCTLAPVCGDGTTEAPEECDDGNNKSGDGCSGICLEEACGNARLDPGEVCDGASNCAADCMSVTGCGDGNVVAPEQCDDGDTVSWDGCSSACAYETSVVLSELNLVDQGLCDLDGDGYKDSRLGEAFSFALSTINDTFVRPVVRSSPFNVIVLQGIEDPSLATPDASLRAAWVRGADANGGAADFDGMGTVQVQAASVSGGNALISFPGSISGAVLDAGPEDVTLPFFGGLQLGLRRAHIVQTPIVVSPGPRYSVAALTGAVCGTTPVRQFAAVGNIIGSVPLPGGIQVATTSCDPAAVPTNQETLADVLVGGVQIGTNTGIYIVNPTQPDVDLDGDGLESYVLAGDGNGCQPVIVACIDGHGDRIEGHGCVLDARMADGFSASFRFTAPSTTLVP